MTSNFTSHFAGGYRFWPMLFCFLILAGVGAPVSAHSSGAIHPNFYQMSNDMDSSAAFQKAIERLDRAVIQKQREQLIKMKDKFRAWTDDSSYAPWAHYYVAYSNYRLNTTFAEERGGVDTDLADEALEHLRIAADHKPTKAEALALMSSFYGMKIDGAFSVMKYGPKANNAIKDALELAPENPRVQLLDAIGDYYKPSFAGGGMKNSIDGLEKSIQLFNNQVDNSTDQLIDWGHAEAYAWLGKLRMEQEEWEEARDLLKTALRIKKDYSWVRDELWPNLPGSKASADIN